MSASWPAKVHCKEKKIIINKKELNHIETL